MITVNEFLEEVRAILDEYNDDGTIISDEETKDIELNAVKFLNKNVRLAYRKSKVYQIYRIVRSEYPNILGQSVNNFEQVDFIGEDQSYPTDGVAGAKAYFFTATRSFIAYIEEYDGVSWNPLITLNETITEVTDYSGVITVTDSSYPVRIRFSGTTHYKHYNRCLYSFPFASDDIPEYKKTVRYDMPDDYVRLKDITTETPEYTVKGLITWIGQKTLGVDFRFYGTINVTYFPKPKQYTWENKTELIEINDPLILEFVQMKTAALSAITENNKIINFLNQLADEAEARAFPPEPATEQIIEDVYGINKEVVW